MLNHSYVKSIYTYIHTLTHTNICVHPHPHKLIHTLPPPTHTHWMGFYMYMVALTMDIGSLCPNVQVTFNSN